MHRVHPALAVAICGLVPAALLGANPADFRVYNYDFYNDNTVDLPGRLYVPTNYNPQQSYPLVLYYHGIGECGTDNTAQVGSNIDNLLAAAKSRGFFLYAPQANTSTYWGLDPLERSLTVVARAASEYSIDTSRLYVTGLSLGGGATWDTLSQYPGVFSAGVPICGVNNTASGSAKPANLVGKDIWAYHARNDSVVNISASRNMVNDIRKADGNKPALTFPLNGSTSNPYYNNGSPYYSDGSTFYSENNLRYTEYASGDHYVWSRAYNESPMYDWMLSQHDGSPKPATGKALLFDFGSQQTRTDSQQRLWNSSTAGVSRTSGAGQYLSFAKTITGERTSVILDVVDRFDGEKTNGLTTGALYDAGIASDSWYTGASTHTAALSALGILAIRGLQPNGDYRIELFASQSDNDGGLGALTRYSIGAEWRDLDPVGNLTSKAIFDSVHADASGVLQLTVGVSPNGTARYAYLGAIELRAVPEPTSALLFPALALLLRRNRRRHTPWTHAAHRIRG